MSFLKNIPFVIYLFMLYFIVFAAIRLNAPKDISAEAKYIADLIYYATHAIFMLVIGLAVYVIRSIRESSE